MQGWIGIPSRRCLFLFSDITTNQYTGQVSQARIILCLVTNWHIPWRLVTCMKNTVVSYSCSRTNNLPPAAKTSSPTYDSTL